MLRFFNVICSFYLDTDILRQLNVSKRIRCVILNLMTKTQRIQTMIKIRLLNNLSIKVLIASHIALLLLLFRHCLIET